MLKHILLKNKVIEVRLCMFVLIDGGKYQIILTIFVIQMIPHQVIFKTDTSYFFLG